MKRLNIGVTCLIVGMLMFAGSAWGAHEDSIALKGYDGKDLALDSQEPYSPKQTCGECHEYDEITNGYHFQQGRTDSAGKIVMSDSFDHKRPWVKSAGMYGKW